MLRRIALAVALFTGLHVGSAQAYTPESGVWWNPSEPGSGLAIEIQDDFIAVFAYVYDSAGNATWYTATGFLDGNARFEGQLDAFRGGQCIGCDWRRNTAFLGSGGPIRIVFDPNDETRATLTWGGRTRQIERYHFYLKRPEDERALPGVRLQLTKSLGEWQSVLDFTDNPSASFQYFGDVTVLDRLAADRQGDFVDGCRPADSLAGECTNADVTAHYAAIEYISSGADAGKHVLVVDNDRNSWAAYFIRIGTNEFSGEVSVYPKGGNPSVYYPVRGFRSASRSFVQEGVGPSKRDKAPARSALPLAWFAAKDAAATSIDPERNALLRRLESRLSSGAATR